MSAKKGACKTDYDISRIQIDQVRSLFNEHIAKLPDHEDKEKHYKIFIKSLNNTNLYYEAEKYVITSILKHFQNDFNKQVEIINTFHLDDRRIQVDLFNFNQNLFATIEQKFDVQIALIQNDLYQGYHLNSFNPIRKGLQDFLLNNTKYDSDIFSSKIISTLNEEQLTVLFKRASFNYFGPDLVGNVFYLYPKILDELLKHTEETGSVHFSFYNLINILSQSKVYPNWFSQIVLVVAKNYLKTHKSDDNQVILKLLKGYNPTDKVLMISDELLYFTLNNYPKMLPEVLKHRDLTLDEKIFVMEREKEIYEPILKESKMITLNNHAYFPNYGTTFEEVLNNLKKSKILIKDL